MRSKGCILFTTVGGGAPKKIHNCVVCGGVVVCGVCVVLFRIHVTFDEVDRTVPFADIAPQTITDVGCLTVDWMQSMWNVSFSRLRTYCAVSSPIQNVLSSLKQTCRYHKRYSRTNYMYCRWDYSTVRNTYVPSSIALLKDNKKHSFQL